MSPAKRPFQRACAVEDPSGRYCMRWPGHGGVHEHYLGGKTISWANDAGWLAQEGQDDEGQFWRCIRYLGSEGDHGVEHDARKFDALSSAEAACEILNLRGAVTE